MKIPMTILLPLCMATAITVVHAQTDARATYIANEGIMVERGETRILFDPLFRYPYDNYHAVPRETEEAIIRGSSPFEGVDAVFISHHHADHFSPGLILKLLSSNKTVTVFAPGQVVSALHRIASEPDQQNFDRIKRIDLAYGDAPFSVEMDDLLIEAVMIPHSGWPEIHRGVENLSFRITLGNGSTFFNPQVNGACLGADLLCHVAD